MTGPLDETDTTLSSAICPGCFNPREGGTAPACPICNYWPNANRSGALLPVGTQLEWYVIGEKLGQGGFGITYRGFDLKLHMKVAIKEYYPSDLAGRSTDRNTVVLNSGEYKDVFSDGLRIFLKEARTLAQMKHPHLVRILNYFELNGTAYLVMDYLEGEDLATDLKRQPGGRLPWRTAVNLVLPVLDGLRKVHEAGFMHRDIKPGNLYRTDEGLILLDFGAARQVTGGHTRSMLIFTKGYAPYEQYLAGQLNRQGPWTDVYGMAATLYHMLTAQRPPPALDRKQNDLLHQPDLLEPAHHFVPDLPPALDAVLSQALAIEPERRLSSIGEFKQRLEAVLAVEESAERPPLKLEQRLEPVLPDEESTILAPPKPSVSQKRPAPLNRNWRGVMATVVLIGLVWGGAWIGLRSPPNQPTSPVTPVETPSVETPPVVKAPMAERSPEVKAPIAETPPPVVKTPPVIEAPAGQAPPVAETPMVEAPPVPVTPVVVEAPPVVVARPALEPEMVRIPGGCFQMGSPASEQGRNKDERRHSVCVEAFEIGKHEVTVREFRQFTSATGYQTGAERNVGEKGCYAWSATGGRWGQREGVNWRQPGYESNDTHPVVCVSWNDAVAYAAWLSQQTARSYRLPTEAEWEYAARAGTTSMRYWGDEPDQACQYANVADRTDGPGGHAWTVKHHCTDQYWYAAPVGSFQANAWQLSDLLGNVWEWTCSAYDSKYGGAETRCAEHNTDSIAVRGGSWFYRPAWTRTAHRDRNSPSRRHLDGGFRLARSF